MKWSDIKFELVKLRLEPGDIAVLATDLMLTKEQAAELCQRFRQEIGSEKKVLVLTHGLKLEVLTRAELEAMVA